MALTVSNPAIGTCCCEPMTTKQLTAPQEAVTGDGHAIIAIIARTQSN
jgi:hypothetical protein